MNRRRHPVAHPPALYRMGTDRDGERMVVWPLYTAAPLAMDGRPDEHVYIRRDIVRRALVSSAAVLPEPKPRRLGWLVERIGRWLSW